MYLKLFVALFLLSSALADFLYVTHDRGNMQLEFDKKEIVFKNKVVKLNMTRKKCNGHIIDGFIFKHSALMQKSRHRVQPAKGDLSYNYKSKKYYTSKKSSLGRYLMELPRYIHKLKLEESFICKKKK